ncbi:ankyrin repeat protein [Thraustotheca clavata]|uniref:Ankyrin repeat protein n=1 Tax=Thraustotheca clavata TaxID=74557 RepID=A0A1W0A305_9STRA|nr:ankyrin repeat protein [Thraustotheca clavata]
MLTLISAGADVNQSNLVRETALFVAAMQGHNEIVSMLISAPAEINKADDDGKIPLYTAAYYGNIDVLKTLISAGADINQVANDGRTPLYIAALGDAKEIALMFISPGTNINQAFKVQWRNTPLHTVAAYGNHESITLTLAAAGGDINQPRFNGRTPLFIAVYYNYTELVRTIISVGGNVNQAANLCTHNEETMSLLIKAGANVNQAKKGGCTPLYIAAQNDCNEVVKLLHAANADPNIFSNNGETALYVAAELGNDDIVWSLLQANAKPNIKANVRQIDEWLNTIDDCNRERTRGSYCFIDPRAKVKMNKPLIIVAIKAGDADKLQFLLSELKEPNITDTGGNGLLHLAINMIKNPFLKCL